MAWGYYFNMEIMALDIAEQHIASMSNDNYYKDDDIKGFIDDEKLYENLKNGFVVITQLNCYVESFLNTVLDRCMNFDEKLLRKNSDEKLKILFSDNPEKLTLICEKPSYKAFEEAKKVRNAMIHWKKTYIGDGTPTPDFAVGNQMASLFFKKSNMNRLLKEHKDLCAQIAAALNLSINNEASAIEVEARDGLVNYVYDPKETEVDPSRWVKQ